ncbi:MAG: hypothetical protein ABSB18_08245 [Candidatus Omnitrophota bacterium]
MKELNFRKILLFSFLGHAMLFPAFRLTFSNMFPNAGISRAYFWGQLPSYPKVSTTIAQDAAISPLPNRIEGLIRKQDYQNRPSYSFALKPAFAACYYPKKEFFTGDYASSFSFERKESPVLFHPVLPYDFTLYFRDRQIAHVELEYKIPLAKDGRAMMIHRKISSGNLEADLLIQRYIARYLLMQRRNLSAGNWQTVKIDLSTTND